MEIAPTDKIEVKGSRNTFEGKPAIIATEVENDGEVLMLRDAGGIPAWSGWRRGWESRRCGGQSNAV